MQTSASDPRVHIWSREYPQQMHRTRDCIQDTSHTRDCIQDVVCGYAMWYAPWATNSAITNQCEYVNESESTKTAIGLGATHRPGGRQWRQSRQGRPKQRDDRGVHVYMKTGAPMPKCLCKKANSHCSPANARCLPAGRSREVAEQTRCSLLAGGARRRRRGQTAPRRLASGAVNIGCSRNGSPTVYAPLLAVGSKRSRPITV